MSASKVATRAAKSVAENVESLLDEVVSDPYIADAIDVRLAVAQTRATLATAHAMLAVAASIREAGAS